MKENNVLISNIQMSNDIATDETNENRYIDQWCCICIMWRDPNRISTQWCYYRLQWKTMTVTEMTCFTLGTHELPSHVCLLGVLHYTKIGYWILVLWYWIKMSLLSYCLLTHETFWSLQILQHTKSFYWIVVDCRSLKGFLSCAFFFFLRITLTHYWKHH